MKHIITGCIITLILILSACTGTASSSNEPFVTKASEKLPDDQVLEITDCTYDEALTALERISPRIETVSFSDMQISISFLEKLSEAGNVQTLRFYSCKMPRINLFDYSGSIKQIDLYSCKIFRVGWINCMDTLESLSMINCDLSDSLFLTNLSKLEYLSLTGTYFLECFLPESGTLKRIALGPKQNVFRDTYEETHSARQSWIDTLADDYNLSKDCLIVYPDGDRYYPYADHPDYGEDALVPYEGYTFDLIRDAVDQNENLSYEEKAFIYKLQFVFDNYYSYMDVDMVINRLQTLSIIFDPNQAANEGVGGMYDSVANTITLFESASFEESDIRILTHEFLHVLQTHPGTFLSELSNECFTRDVIRELYDNSFIDKELLYEEGDTIPVYGKSYSKNIFFFYALIKLFDPDTLIRYQFQNDEFSLANHLPRDYRSDFIDFFYASEKLRSYDPGSGYHTTNDDENAKRLTLDRLNIIYNGVLGLSVEEDLEVVASQIWDISDVTRTALKYTTIRSVDGKTNSYYFQRYPFPKSYINNKYNTARLIIRYEYEGADYEIELNDEMCDAYRWVYHYCQENSDDNS